MLTDIQKKKIEDYIEGKSTEKPEETPEALKYAAFFIDKFMLKCCNKTCKNIIGRM